MVDSVLSEMFIVSPIVGHERLEVSSEDRGSVAVTVE